MTTKNILIADDDTDLVTALSMRCKILGLEVLVAHDGMTALSLIDEWSPDLIILDVNMPFGDGLSVCEMLGPENLTQTTPVIILTGSSDGDVVRRCHSMCAYYVLKSADVWERLGPLISDLLDLKPATKDEQEATDAPVVPQAPTPPLQDPLEGTQGSGLTHLTHFIEDN